MKRKNLVCFKNRIIDITNINLAIELGQVSNLLTISRSDIDWWAEKSARQLNDNQLDN